MFLRVRRGRFSQEFCQKTPLGLLITTIITATMNTRSKPLSMTITITYYYIITSDDVASFLAIKYCNISQPLFLVIINH